jgi:succinate dehydrogenase / fumarate reductase, cytochrome b subunit
MRAKAAALLRSSIGSKAVVAVTGLGLMLFVIGHMLGNLQVFLGRDALNSYAQGLKDMPAVLWTVRLGLLLFFVTHVVLALKLYRDNRAARPEGYVYGRRYAATNPAARTMFWTGLAVLFFLIYHLLHFTFGTIQGATFAGNLRDPLLDRPDVYAMVVLGFQNPLVVLSYVLANLCLGVHLYHAGSSIFQTLGMNHPKYNPAYRRVGPIVALVVTAGNVLMPVLIFFGFYPDPVYPA